MRIQSLDKYLLGSSSKYTCANRENEKVICEGLLHMYLLNFPLRVRICQKNIRNHLYIVGYM